MTNGVAAGDLGKPKAGLSEPQALTGIKYAIGGSANACMTVSDWIEYVKERVPFVHPCTQWFQERDNPSVWCVSILRPCKWRGFTVRGWHF